MAQIVAVRLLAYNPMLSSVAVPWVVAGLLVLWFALACARLLVLRRRVAAEAHGLSAATGPERAIAAQRHDDRAFAFNRARRRWWARMAVPFVAPAAVPYVVIQGWVDTASQLSRSIE